MHRHPPNTVAPPVTAAPAHAARPAPACTGRLATLGAALLIAIGLGIAAQQSAGGPAHSTPSSALFMKESPGRQ